MHNIRTNDLLVFPSKHTNTVLFLLLTLHYFSHLSAVASFLHLVVHTAEPWCWEENQEQLRSTGLQSPSFHVSLRATSITGTFKTNMEKATYYLNCLCRISAERNCYSVAIISMLYRWKQLWPPTDNLKSAQYAIAANEPWSPTKYGVLLAKPFITRFNIQLVFSNTKYR